MATISDSFLLAEPKRSSGKLETVVKPLDRPDVPRSTQMIHKFKQNFVSYWNINCKKG